MRILMVMLEGKGGMFQYGTLLANALAEKHDVFAIVPRPSDPVFTPSVKVTEMPVGDTKARFVKNTLNITRLFRFIREVNRINADVIHFHNPYSPWTCLAMPWMRRYAKVTTIPEGVLHSGMQGRVEMRVARNLHARAADALIVLCQFDKDCAESYSRGKPVFIIPHGINTLFLDTKISASLKVIEDSVLFFGGIAPFKGLEYLLQAFAIVQQTVPEARLIIAGRGSTLPYNKMLAKVNNLEIDNRFIPMDKTAEYFRRAKFLVMPYIEDDHSGVVPIACAFGKPVIVSDKVADMVEDGKTGLVIPARDCEALSQAIVRLLRDNKLLHQMGRNAENKARAEWSWDRIAEQTLAVYRSVTTAKKEKSVRWPTS